MEQGATIEIAKIERSITLEKALIGITLKKAVQLMDEELIICVLINLIHRTAGFFNVSKPMTEDQATDTAYLLLEKYPFETIEDFIVMFREGKLGKFGKNYNRIDGLVIFEWMEIYMDRKATHRENLHKSQKFNDSDISLLKVVEDYSKEEQDALNGPKSSPDNAKTLADALKEAIGYEELERLEKNEKDYYEFKKKYIVQNSVNEKKRV